MCLIVRGRIGDLLDLDLAYAQMANSDGWGIHTSRNTAFSFSSKEKDITKFLATRRKETMATIHFRFATHGGVHIGNAHPFSIGENQFLMHNGVLSGDAFQHKHRSDTLQLALLLRGCSSELTQNYILEHLVEDQWYSNRFCVLRGTTWKKYGDWIYDKSTKTWHSNRTLLGGFNSHIPTAITKLPAAASKTFASRVVTDDDLLDDELSFSARELDAEYYQAILDDDDDDGFRSVSRITHVQEDEDASDPLVCDDCMDITDPFYSKAF